MRLTLPSPIQCIENDLLSKQNIVLYIKRDDLIHPEISGNKWRKLMFNIESIKKPSTSTILTFGGAFSNHIYATAATGKLFDIKTIGIIRGYKNTPLSPTLLFAEKQGMSLHFASREVYKDKDALINTLKGTLGDIYIIPEGGANALGSKGCTAIVEETHQQLGYEPNYWCVPCGTGTTLSGIIQASSKHQHCLGFSALKIDNWQKDMEKHLNTEGGVSTKDNWSIFSDYHFGGYTKWAPELIHFINHFKKDYNIALDPIYTGKMFYGIFDLIQKGYFPKGSRIVAVHTGGLQGIEGFNTLKLKKHGLMIE